MTLPAISLVTPSLNQGEFIEKTILSVLSQEYPHLEYIVMDGGSSDNTPGVLKRYSDRISWASEPDHGQTNAINKGLRMTHGAIIGYLNADDTLSPGSLWKVAEAFANQPDAMWATGKCRIVDEKGVEIRRSITRYKNLLLGVGSLPVLLMTNYISQPSTFWRRDALGDVGFLDENLHYTMDYEYWLRLHSRFPLLFIPEYLASFTIHPASKTTSMGHRDVYIREEKEVIRRYTRSRVLWFLHDLHRSLMTGTYTVVNHRWR